MEIGKYYQQGVFSPADPVVRHLSAEYRIKVTSTTQADFMCLLILQAKKTQHHFCDILPKMHSLNLMMRKHQIKLKVRDILQNNWPALATYQVMKDKRQL